MTLSDNHTLNFSIRTYVLCAICVVLYDYIFQYAGVASHSGHLTFLGPHTQVTFLAFLHNYETNLGVA